MNLWPNVGSGLSHCNPCCRFGVWRIEATYTDDFSTQASAEFEVKEYGKSTATTCFSQLLLCVFPVDHIALIRWKHFSSKIFILFSEKVNCTLCPSAF